jgi:hypothetical protein
VKGEMNKDFGFVSNRPFYLRTRLPSGRAIEVQGARNLIMKTILKNRPV